jgi:hypothetical protein
MDAAKIQAKIFKGLGKAAKALGTSFYVYRSASMMSPLDKSNVLVEGINASFTTSYAYAKYNKPSVPDWTLVADATDLMAGDWFSDGNHTYFIAEIQGLLPIPAIQCSELVSISRPSSDPVVVDGGGAEPGEALIAENFPLFMMNKKDKSNRPGWFPTSTDSTIAMPEWVFYINTRNPGDIQSHDIITDSLGIRYEIDTPARTSWGFIVTAKLEKP